MLVSFFPAFSCLLEDGVVCACVQLYYCFRGFYKFNVASLCKTAVALVHVYY